MNTTKEVELLDNSQVKLKITIPADEIRKQYEEIVSEYCQKAYLKGFRRGKAPRDVVVRKLGSALMDQVRSEVLEKCLSESFDTVEHKPLPFASPDVKADGAMEQDKDFLFEVTYDTYPAVNLGAYTGLEIEEPDFEITADDLDRELKELQAQNALFTEKESGTVQKGDVVNINYSQIDADGHDVKDTKREGFVFEVGTGYNVYKLDDDLIGWAKGDEKTVAKTYPEDFEVKVLAGKTIQVKVLVNSIKEKKLPAINDELAQDISEKFQTLEDLKKDITERLSAAAKDAVRSRTLNAVLDKVLETSTFPLPASMVDYQIESMWNDYLQRTQLPEERLVEMMRSQGRSLEDLRKDWTPAAEKRARLQVVISEISKKESIGLEDEEMEAEISRMAETRGMAPEELKENLSKNNLMDYMKSNLKMGKLNDFLLSKTVTRKGAKANLLDLLSGK